MSSLVTLFSDDCVLPSTANVKFAQASLAPYGQKYTHVFSIPKIVLIYGGHMSNAQEVYRLLNAELDRRKFGLVIIRVRIKKKYIGNRYYFSLNVKFRIIISSVENQSQRLSPLNLQLSLAFDLNQPKSASRMLRANEDMLEEYYNHGLFLECIQKDLACSLDDIYQSADENIETVEDEIQSINVKLFFWAAFFDHYNLSLHFWRRLN
ncbi:unnamed protein product, partial [Rotaria magnacalcarata]